MWQTVNYKGNTVKWYEAELIEQIRKECEYLKRIFKDDKGAVYVAERVLEHIKSYEGER